MRFLALAASLALLGACNQQSAQTETADPNAPQASEQVGAQLIVAMARAAETGPGESVGTVAIRDSAGGAVFELNLTGLPPGEHGFHVHETGDCSPAHNGAPTPAGAAGGHWDPQNTGRHAGPEGDGHLGDLPRLVVGADGRASGALTAPRIQDASQLRGRALMIHAGGDTYSDTPELGGGGARIACGAIG